MPVSDHPVWFITGCSTGFGRTLAAAVLKRGWRAVVTARNVADVEDLVSGHHENALALALDVTDAAAIAEAVDAAQARFGSIDVLVNNAGYGYLAAIEEGEDEPVRAMFDTNVFGLVAMTKADSRSRPTSTQPNVAHRYEQLLDAGGTAGISALYAPDSVAEWNDKPTCATLTRSAPPTTPCSRRPSSTLCSATPASTSSAKRP